MDERRYLKQLWDEVPPPTERAEREARARLTAELVAPRRRPGRPPALLAAALLIGLTLLAAPAIGGEGIGHVIRFLRGDPSDEIVGSLRRLDQGAPPGMDQRPIVGKTGKVFEADTKYGVVRIWLTPTKKGGYCKSFEAPNEQGKTRNFGGGCMPKTLFRPIEVGGTGGGTDPTVGWLDGRVAAAIVQLELEYVNGRREEVALQNGFFATPIEPVRMLRGTDHPARFIGKDEDGNVVAVEEVKGFFNSGISHFFGERPPIAIVQEERELVSIPAGGATAKLFVSPSRTSGTCARVAVAGENWEWNCAEAAALPNPIRWALHRVPAGGRPALVVDGIVRPGTRVRFEYQDGFVEEPALHDQRFLVSIPADRWKPGRRLAAIVAVDQDGKAAMRFPMATRGAAFYDGPTDRRGHQVVNDQRRPDWPVVANVVTKTEHAGDAVLEVRRKDKSVWLERLTVGGKLIGSSELQWFPGGDRTISIEWVPVLSDDGRHDAYLYSGRLGEGVRARAVYRDGSTEEIDVVRPREQLGSTTGFFLLEVTEERREKGFTRFEGLDADGNVVVRVAAPPVA